jgi:hypothetical protein
MPVLITNPFSTFASGLEDPNSSIDDACHEHDVFMRQAMQRGEWQPKPKFPPQIREELKDWDEGAHPRDEHGRFGEGGGGGLSLSKPQPPPSVSISVETAHRIVGEVAAKTGFDPKQVTISDEVIVKNVGGQSGTSLGYCHKETMQITIFHRAATSEKILAGTAAHEFMHGKQFLVDKKAKDKLAAFETLNAQFDRGPGLVSDYASRYWDFARYHGRGSPQWKIAEMETLAEMARIEYETGKLPGSKEWKDYYAAINSAYSDLVKHK